jgi:hypothetical protein
MTEFASFPPAHQTAPRPLFRQGYCIAAAIVTEVIGLPAAVVVWFLGLIVDSGCFIECSVAQPDHSQAFLLYCAAALLALSGPLLLGILMRMRQVVIGTLCTAAVAVAINYVWLSSV